MSDVVNQIETKTVPVTAFAVIRDDVKKAVQNAHDSGVVRKRVVDHLAEKEIARRTDLLMAALEKRREFEKSIERTRPETVGYSLEGVKISESFSKAQIDTLKKTKERLGKIDKAINAAVEKADYSLLEKVKDMKVDSKDEPKDEESSAEE